MFRMLDEEWTPLSPNRQDCRPYQGSNCENEKFYGGRSVVFCVSADFFEKDASGVVVQLHVKKDVSEYFEMNSRQDVGYASVPVDDLLNGISRQIRERNELAEYLSDFYKRQIISRSTKGTYTLRSEDLQDTVATISLYIRISCLGRSVVTEIASIEGPCGLFRVHGELDEEDPYLTRKLTGRVAEGECWDDLPPIPRGRLVCRCEELVAKDVMDLSDDRFGYVVNDDTINGAPTPIRREPPRDLQDDYERGARCSCD
ncbi:hypothetical protein X777_03057 [Ooceraea biroi]|nr:hypothetical protein X777_03057 [Ooceraea biroi]